MITVHRPWQYDMKRKAAWHIVSREGEKSGIPADGILNRRTDRHYVRRHWQSFSHLTVSFQPA